MRGPIFPICATSAAGRALAAIGLALGLAAAAAGVALAHASLIRSDPPANTRLERSPESVSVWFDEPIEPGYTFLSVYDRAGQRVDRLDARFAGGREPSITLSVPELPAGSYVVVWRVISLDDGHAVGGAFAFGVNAPPDPAAAAEAGRQADTQPDLTTFLIRFLSLMGQVVFVGAIVFLEIVWRPVLNAAQRAGWLTNPRVLDPEQRRWVQILADILVGALITGLLGSLYVQSRTTGVIFWQLLGTRWGIIWLARAAVVLLASLWMESLLEGRRPARWAWGLSLALLLTTSLTSHSAAKPGLLGPTADFVHQAAASTWAGGLVMLGLTLLIVRRSALGPEARGRLGTAAVTRYSALASIAVGLLAATGLVLGLQQVQTWAGLLLTGYGRALVVKLVLVVAALALGAYNSFRSDTAQRLGRIALESAMAAAVVFAAAVLVDLPPAATADTSGTALANETGVTLEARIADLTLSTRVSPGRIGSNVFELSLFDDGGQPALGEKAVLHFQSLDGGPASDLPLAEASPGIHVGTSAGLNQPGGWLITVKIDRPSPLNADFDVAVGLDGVVRSASAPLPLTVQVTGWLNQYGRAALALMLVAFAIGWTLIANRARRGLDRAG
jgi:copper transport protein